MRNIAVIMPSYLHDYAGAAKNRGHKFLRAVKSFQLQQYENKHLVIVSHGCDITISLYKLHFATEHNIHLLTHGRHENKPIFFGSVRQMGIDYAIKKLKADIITYLDSDDFIMPDHLHAINEIMNGYDWIYYNDQLLISETIQQERIVQLHHGSIGTSAISHKAKKQYSWKGCDGYGHDWTFIQKLKNDTNNYTKVAISSYVVCHNPNLMDN